MLNQLAQKIHENNKAKGFYDDEKNIGEMLCLVHSEISEALESDRKEKYADIPEWVWEDIDHMQEPKKYRKLFLFNLKDTFEDEIADAIIRLLDISAYKGIDIERHIAAKMKYNSMRPHKHGKKY